MTPPKFSCLIIDLMHPTIEPMLEAIGVAVDYRPEIKKDEIKEILPAYDGLLVRSKIKVNAEILANADRLKFVARAGAGVDNIDEASLAQKNIALINAPEGNKDAVGEFTLGLLLALFRNVVKADKEVRAYQWLREANRGEEIMGKTIGLIGYGHMGRAFARRLAGFNCEVLAYDKDDGLAADEFARLVPLTEIFAKADVVSLHIPYIPENKHFANEAFFNSFSKKIWLINTARGEIINQTDLVKYLNTGKVRGAALDVLENEKLLTLTETQKRNFDFLAAADNVILTPHIGGWSHQSYVKINEVLVQKIKELLQQTDAD
ncbi:NAD(P)-dependent oxidoreductase [Adhaeribacter rhizoryzae]|uniref:Phosphoglycerate dehydrogenase n=1 Tax=Adhaeribacter rhizoryzae TaxID=2607907 RepID=A0A5M6DPM8_9BACT|nr:NAD(P)-dependent oxidoreductase [Adhaeribacter rhizoryzae]KAA5548150.1 phosphoglycerate dehydrogenase [Adhaeribacter rhizoryzae]